ncbi:DUF3726 domain-containing protein [Enterovibrio calviensis]|uniref:DUF3726 domain-containing protein n=1 Tax=Enterovibrio calviensis TaxID=91359 RepID=UPI003735AB96
MMQVSHNELVTLCTKAYDSLKRQCGEAETIANMVVDLEMAGLQGMSFFLAALESIEQDTDYPVPVFDADDHQIKVDLGGASLLCHFPALIDVALEQLIHGQRVQLHIRDCHNRWFGFGELLKLAGKGLSVRAQWRNDQAPNYVDYVHNAGFRYPNIYFDNPGQLRTQPLFSTKMHPEQLQKNDLLVDIQLYPFEIFRANSEPDISAEMQSVAEQRAWKHGIDIEENDWNTLKKYVARSLVENSERSLQGAGE